MQEITLEEPTRETLLDSLSTGSTSNLQKYQDLFVGGESLLDLVKYELLAGFMSAIPGALGLFLRKTFFKSLFAQVGDGLIVGPHVTLRCPGRMSLGKNVVIDGNAVLDAKGADSQIILGDSVLVGKDTTLSCTSATISIGIDVSIGPYCYLRAGLAPIQIGSFVTIGSHTTIVSGSPSYKRLDIPMKRQLGNTQGITLENDIWIGVGVRILDGVKLGSGSVVGAGAVVLEDIPAYAIAAGIPARVIGYRS